MVGVAVHQHVELGVGGDAGEGEVAGADDGEPPLPPAAGAAPAHRSWAVVEDVGFGVQPPLGVDADVEPFLLDEAHQRLHHLCGVLGLIHQATVWPRLAAVTSASAALVDAAWEVLGFGGVA